MKAYQADYTIAMLCRVLEVSTSGYYAWRKRPPSQRRQSGPAARRSHRSDSFAVARRLWSPRIHAELTDEGVHVSGKRIARLMRERAFGAFAGASGS